MSWVDCVVNNDYEINTSYPHQIRRKKDKYIMNEWICRGYVQVKLQGEYYYKHRIIAMQFIPNINNLPCIDHVNTIRTDNRICNLRWVSVSENNYNKASYNGVEFIYLDELPENSIEILNHNDFIFRDYYIDDEANIYHFNGARYKKLRPDKQNRITIRDITNNRHHFSINSLIRAFL